MLLPSRYQSPLWPELEAESVSPAYGRPARVGGTIRSLKAGVPEGGKVRSSVKLLLVALISFAMPATASAQLKGVPGQPVTWSFNLEGTEEEAIAAILGGAQSLGFVPAGFEKSLGLFKFEPRFLTAEELDNLCEYPVIWKFNSQAFDTFAKWNQRSTRSGAGAVEGSISLVVRVASADSGRTVTATATFKAGKLS